MSSIIESVNESFTDSIKSIKEFVEENYTVLTIILIVIAVGSVYTNKIPSWLQNILQNKFFIFAIICGIAYLSVNYPYAGIVVGLIVMFLICNANNQFYEKEVNKMNE